MTLIDDTQYRLIAGECEMATAMAIVRSIDEHQLLEVQLIENLDRKYLTTFEESAAFRRLTVEFKLTQEQVAQRIGKTQAANRQVLGVLD